MIINGCLVNNTTGIDEEILNEIFEDIGYTDEIKNEALAIVGGDYEVYIIDGDEDEFTISSKEDEYRCIHEDEIETIFENEADEVYDEDMWREEVANEATTEGYDDWFKSIVDEADYGSFFASCDGKEEMCGKYYIFRVN